MKTNSMKRLACMKPLARAHGIVLVCAQYGRQAIRASVADRIKLADRMRTICREEITPNLEDEQWVLSPLIGDADLRKEFHQRHRNIRKLTKLLFKPRTSLDPGLGLMSRVANVIDDYVRWEENILYPRIEDGLEKYNLARLSKLTSKLETDRNHKPKQIHRQKAATLSSLSDFPKETQLLLAYSLVTDNSNISLMQIDKCASPLLTAKWLVEVPNPTIGLVTFKIKPQIWCKLLSLSTKYLSKDLLYKLESFKKRKSAYYPWVW